MQLSLSALLAGFIFGVFGLYVFKEGKKRGNYYVISIGIILMIYTYFTPNVWWDWGVGCSLMYLAYRLRYY